MGDRRKYNIRERRKEEITGGMVKRDSKSLLNCLHVGKPESN